MTTLILVTYLYVTYYKFSPFCTLGGGFDENRQGVGLSKMKYLPKINGAVGLEYMVNSGLGLSISSGCNYYLNDDLDGTRAGSYNDLSWGVSLGVKIYLIKMKQK